MKYMKTLIGISACLVLILAGCGTNQEDLEIVTVPEETTAIVETEATKATETVQETEVSQPAEATDDSAADDETAAADSESTEPEHKHNYKFKVTKMPTCTASGIRTYTCAECGASYTENIKPLDHAFVITTTEATCTASGYTTYKCKECGHTYTDNIKEPLGHTYGPLVTVRNPTELEPGLAEHICNRCGERETVVLPKLNANG